MYCLIRSAPIVLGNVNCFQLATVHVSITLPCVFLTCRVDSPALNQAHPVSPGIKPQRTQSCLLDCTGWFTAVFQAFIPQLPIPTVRVIVIVSSSVSACFCLSRYPLPQCTYDPSGFNPRSPLDSDYCLRPCTSAQWFPDSTHACLRTRLGLPSTLLITGKRTLDCLTTLWFLQ